MSALQDRQIKALLSDQRRSQQALTEHRVLAETVLNFLQQGEVKEAQALLGHFLAPAEPLRSVG